MKLYPKIFVFLLLVGLVSCNDMQDVEKVITLPENQKTGKMLVLSEGLFNMNNSRLSYYNFETKELKTNYFKEKNKRGLGDTANDMIRYGSKIYIVVNVSSQVEVIDANTGYSVKQIPVFDEDDKARQPRYLKGKDGKVYVTCFDGNLLRIDTVKLEIDGIFVPCITTEKDIEIVVNATQLPTNVMAMPELPNFDTLKKLGAKRISSGNFLNDKIYGNLEREIKTIAQNQNFNSLFYV